MAVVAGGSTELTPEEAEAKVALCHHILEELIASLALGKQALWLTAKSLYQFDQESGWSVLGYETLGEWLADPEINMTRATYYRLTRAYRTLVVERNVPESSLTVLDVSKVDIVIPAIESGKVTMDAALGDAEALASPDLREKYLGKKPKAQSSAPGSGAIPTPDAPPGQAGTVAPSAGEPVPASDVPTKHPSKKEFDEMVARAKKRRRNFVQYAQWVGKWSLMSGEGTNRTDWNVLPPPDGQSDAPAVSGEGAATSNGTGPQVASGEVMDETAATLDQAVDDWLALRASLLDAVASGARNPRVDGTLLRAGVQGADLIVSDWRVCRGHGGT